jgi:dethiobiotin synthetase
MGTINHTLLSLRELARSGLRILGVVMNEAKPTAWGLVQQDNYETVEALGNAPMLGRLPFLPALRTGRVAPDVFRAAVSACLPPAHEIIERIQI